MNILSTPILSRPGSCGVSIRYNEAQTQELPWRPWMKLQYEEREGCNRNIMCWYMSRIHLKDVDGDHQECERVHFGESDEPELSQRLIITEFNLTQRQILKCKNTLAKLVSNLILLNIVRNIHISNEKLRFNRSKRVYKLLDFLMQLIC